MNSAFLSVVNQWRVETWSSRTLSTQKRRQKGIPCRASKARRANRLLMDDLPVELSGWESHYSSSAPERTNSSKALADPPLLAPELLEAELPPDPPLRGEADGEVPRVVPRVPRGPRGTSAPRVYSQLFRTTGASFVRAKASLEMASVVTAGCSWIAGTSAPRTNRFPPPTHSTAAARTGIAARATTKPLFIITSISCTRNLSTEGVKPPLCSPNVFFPFLQSRKNIAK